MIFYDTVRFLDLIIFKLFFKFKVYGINNFPKKRGFIIASNHLSYFDPAVVAIACQNRVNFFAKEELFRNKIFGFIIKLLGAIPVNRRDRQNIGAFKRAFEVLSENGVMVIFPEGTRSQNGRLQKLHSGVGFLALKSRCPVVPLFIAGTDRVFPAGSKSIKFGKISAYVAAPILPPLSDDYKNYGEFSLKVEESLRELEKKALKNTNAF